MQESKPMQGPKGGSGTQTGDPLAFELALGAVLFMLVTGAVALVTVAATGEIWLGMAALVVILGNILAKGAPAFVQTYIGLEIAIPAERGGGR